MLVLNMKKSCSMVFGTRHGLSHSPELLTNFSDGTPLERGNVFKYLGHWMDPELTFKPHFGYMCKWIYVCLGSLHRSINCFSFQVRRRIISQLMLPILDYADVVYQNTTDTILKNVNILNNSLCRFVTVTYYLRACDKVGGVWGLWKSESSMFCVCCLLF